MLDGPAPCVVPPLAVRRPRAGLRVVALSLPTAIAIVGLLVAPAAAPLLWVLLYGIGTGATFPLAIDPGDGGAPATSRGPAGCRRPHRASAT